MLRAEKLRELWRSGKCFPFDFSEYTFLSRQIEHGCQQSITREPTTGN